MAEGGEKEVVIPSGLEHFVADARRTRCGLQGVEGQLTNEGEIFRGMILAAAAGVLVEQNVENPVKVVLDAPVDAHDLEQAGASLLVVEAVPAAVGAVIASRAQVPVIGIGAGADVDGQVLVYTDVLGLGSGHVPRFVRRYANARTVWTDALLGYVRDVRARAYPTEAETYGMSDEERSRFNAALDD